MSISHLSYLSEDLSYHMIERIGRETHVLQHGTLTPTTSCPGEVVSQYTHHAGVQLAGSTRLPIPIRARVIYLSLILAPYCSREGSG